MKVSIGLLFLVSAILVSGCGGADPETTARLEEKITVLEQRVTTLEANLQETRLDLAAKENQVVKLQEDLRNVETILNKASVRLDRAERR